MHSNINNLAPLWAGGNLLTLSLNIKSSCFGVFGVATPQHRYSPESLCLRPIVCCYTGRLMESPELGPGKRDKAIIGSRPIIALVAPHSTQGPGSCTWKQAEFSGLPVSPQGFSSYGGTPRMLESPRKPRVGKATPISQLPSPPSTWVSLPGFQQATKVAYTKKT